MNSKKIITLLILLFVGVVLLINEPMVAGDFPFIFPESLIERFDIPRLWREPSAVGLGEYTASTLWGWPLSFLYGLGAKLGLGFVSIERFLGVIPVVLIGTFSIYQLTKYLKIKNKFVSVVFYLLNTYLLLIVDGGQFNIALAYAWFPLVYLLVIESLGGSFRRNFIAGLAVSVLGFFDIRFVYILFLLLFLRFFYEFLFLSKKKWLGWSFSWVKSAVIICIVYIGLNAYWVMPAILAQAPTLPVTYQRISQTSFLSFANLGHSLFLLQPHWYKNVFGKVTPLLPAFVLIPILVFLAPILKKKDKNVGFWIVIALVGAFLVKGTNPPLGSVYPWLFENIPGFSMFRDPTKFFFLVALSYSVLIGVTVDKLTKRFKWKLKVASGSESRTARRGKWKIAIVPMLLVSYFLLLSSPVWLGKMTGTFSKPVYQDEYFKIADVLQEDKEFARVFWIPTKAPLGYSSPTHPSVEMSRLIQKRPFAIGTVGTYETANFVREAPFMGELFDISAIKYIAYPYPDTRREKLKQDNIDYYYAFLDQLTNLDWVDSRISEPPVPVLKTKKSQDHFFIALNTYLVVGSDRIYWDLMKIKNFSLSKNALVFAEEQSGLGNNLVDTEQVKILLYDKQALDLAVTLIDKENFIFPAQNLDFDPDDTGWWKREAADLVWWKNFLQQKYGMDNLDFDYGGGWAVAEGNRQLTINNAQFAKGNILLARVISSNRGGKIEFYQGDEKIGEINSLIEQPDKMEIKLTGYKEIPDQIFEYDKAGFFWHEVGTLTINDQPLTIKTQGEINVVNALAVIDSGEWRSVNKKVDEWIDEERVIYWENLTEEEKINLFAAGTDAEISYQRLSPTHYKVTVEGAERNVTLAFSETYDPLWTIGKVGHCDSCHCEEAQATKQSLTVIKEIAALVSLTRDDTKCRFQSSYPLYSLINGFKIEKDGEYDIYFSAQKYVLPGLYVSGGTLAFIIFSLLLLSKRKGTKI